MIETKEKQVARNDPIASPTMELGAALDLAGRVIERRSSIPILECVRLSAPGLVEGTDLDLALAIKVGTFGAPEDGIAFQHRPLTDAVKNTDGSIKFCDDEKGAFIAVGEDPTVELRPTKGDWPAIKPPEDLVEFDLIAADLARDLTDVSAGISSEETRYYLNGVLWHVAEERLRLAATDGHRLHRISRPLPGGLTKLKESIVPRRAIKVLRKALEAQPEATTVHAEFGTLKARFTVGAVTLTTKLIDGTFPDYKRVIPTAPKGGMKLAADDLIQAATAISRIMGRDRPGVVLHLKDGAVTASNPEGIKIRASLGRELIGEPTTDEVGFRHDYLVAALEPFAGSSVTMSLDDAASPCVFETDDDERVLTVLMPMRV